MKLRGSDMEEYHTCTSTEPYDRHLYEVHLNGEKYVFDDYEHVRRVCHNTDAVVYVIDNKKTKKRVSDSKGFGWVVTEVFRIFQNV